MKVLLIGGTGLISTGIVKHLQARGAQISMFNRGKRENRLTASVARITGDRDQFDAFERRFRDERFDVVMDMVCFTPQQAHSAVRAFSGRCGQFILCSTVCTYGVKAPSRVLIDETFPQEPISEYGKNKVACERIFNQAHEAGSMPVTIIRPSSTYGPGNALIDNLEFNPVAWDRVARNLPVLCSGDGQGLWVATHRDDCGKLFAYAAMNSRTYGQSYNATRDENFTWRDYYQQTAAALGTTAQLLFMPADWIVRHDPKRFNLLKEITQYHGAYDSSKAKRDVPEFTCEIGFQQGAAETLADVRLRNGWRGSEGDAVYDDMVQKALAAGIEPIAV